MMELTMEGERLASRFIETLRSFVLDTVREERSGDGMKSDVWLSRRAGSDVSYDLLYVMKKLFVVNPAFVRDNMDDSENCREEDRPKPQSPNSFLNCKTGKKWQGKIAAAEKDKRLVSKRECKEVRKLKVIDRDIIIDDAACSSDGLGTSMSTGEPEFALKKTKDHNCNLQNRTGVMRRSYCRDEEVDHFSLPEHNSEVGGGHNLFDSADSGVFVSMGGMSYGRCEEAFPMDDEVLNKSVVYSNGKYYKGHLYESPEGDSCTSTSVNNSNSQGEHSMHSRSRIPVLSKSRRNSLTSNKGIETNWMDSLRESIMKFKDYDFGATSIPGKPINRSFDRSTSMEFLDSIKTFSGHSEGKRLKSAQSMVSLNYIAPRLDESASFWKQRTSLEQLYSQYLEDEKQVLKDVKCDIEYEEANDIAKRRLRETKRGISRSLFDISAIQQPKVYREVSPQTRKSERTLKKATSLSSLRCLEAWGNRTTNKPMDSRLSLGKSKIPVFIGHV